MKVKVHKMKNRFYPILVCFLLALMVVNPAVAQDDDQLILKLNRDFGYGGMGNDIQGLFSLEIRNPPANLERVEFTIDGELIAVVNQSPFKIQFSTDSYTLGVHVLAAIGYTTDGKRLSSNEFTMEFVSPEAGWQSALKIIGPVFGIIIGVFLLSFLLTLRSGRKQANLPPGTPRNYGFKGGTICSKCSRPFAFQFLSLNMGPFHKVDRCPYCGRWGLVRRKSLEELRAAEAAELSGKQEFGPETSEEDRLRKDLEDSRYQNL
jgi:hypothetical protein